MPVCALLIKCPDEKGLIHRVTGVLLQEGANIVANGEHVDAATGSFFMRTEFSAEASPDSVATKVRAVLPAGSQVECREQRSKDCVLLATREPHCLGDLLLRNVTSELPLCVRAVVSQYDSLGGLVERFGIPFHHVPVTGPDRLAHEAAVVRAIESYAPEYLVLAKYMRVLSDDFVSRWENRIINIHHSFLPAFVGARPYEQAHRRGVKIIGATAHFVNGDLDQGPIITQNVLSVDHSHNPDDMARAGRDVEKICLARALRLVFEDRVLVSANRTIVFD